MMLTFYILLGGEWKASELMVYTCVYNNYEYHWESFSYTYPITLLFADE